MEALMKKRKILGYVFLLPMVLMLIIFMFYPIVESIIRSFTNWTGLNDDYRFIGFNNYIRLFTETPAYWKSMTINLRFAFTSTIVQTVLGFFLAVLVFNLTPRWQNFFKTGLYLPVVMPAAVVAVLWRSIYTPDYGMLNQLLRAVHLEALTRAWMGDARYALNAIIVTNTWRYIGFTMVLFYVSMLDIPKEMMESARIDGANAWNQIRYFYFPLTRGALEINFILSITGGLRAFDLFYLMNGPGTSTKVVGMQIYQTAFIDMKYGRALAMSVVLFLVVVITTVVSRFFLTRNVEDS